MAKLVCGLLALMLLASAAFGQASGPQAIDWTGLGLGFLGGLALFLYGVDVLARSLRELGGGRLEKLLQRASSNRFKGLASGAIATVALDSSSVTIILLITAIDAGLIALANALPVILGANIGTTISSQIFAWNIDRYSPVLIAGGMLWRALAKTERGKHRATIMIGIGLVLFGLSTIGAAAEPLQQDPRVLSWLQQLETPLYGVAAGALATIAIQSSSAMMGITITLAASGLISLPAGIAIMLGAEIGTCADTLIAAFGRSRAALKAGLFHLGFNLVTVAAGLVLIRQLAAFGEATGDNVGQQIANAHVLFNVVGALVVLPFVGGAARLLDRLVPSDDDDSAMAAAAKPAA